MEYQLEHHEISNESHGFELKLLVDNLQSPSNFGMMIRMAEAMGVKEVIFYSKNYTELTIKMKRSSRSAENNLRVRFTQDMLGAITHFKQNNFEIIGLDYTSESMDIRKSEFTYQPKVLICGNESFGLSQEIISQCDFCVHLPMYGKNTSMNVVMATSIAVWEIINAKP